MSHPLPKHTWVRKFAVAFAGLFHTGRTQSSMRVHGVCGVLAVGLAVLTGLSAIEWALLFLVIGLVLGMELLNTAIEAVVDLACPEQAELARIAKDAAAAAVLVAAFTALLVGSCVFLPHWRHSLGF